MSNVSLVVFASLLTFYATRLCLYLPAYRHRMWFARYNQHDFPQSYTVYNWIGLMYKDVGRRFEALGYFMDGLSIRPLDFRLLFNCASLLAELGKLKESYEMFEKCKGSLIPDTLEDKMMTLIDQKQVALKAAIHKYQGKKGKNK